MNTGHFKYIEEVDEDAALTPENKTFTCYKVFLLCDIASFTLVATSPTIGFITTKVFLTLSHAVFL